ncbi:MAG: methylenetetrahydrofolate reductase C-terminal domain-containing protein [Nitrospinae bacterium]|nr:methylenetetrahydrofolate reductase C-terminal domain-containing protein [Nitrospinota bacterium]
MIITKRKENPEILNKLTGNVKKVFLVGCGECATVCKTGGENELNDLENFLTSNNIDVVAKTIVDATCNEPGAGLKLRKLKEEKRQADAFIVMSCGAGVQAITEKVEANQLVLPGCDSLFLGNIKRINDYNQKCSTCGECIIGDFGGLCPVTRCPKGLLNGPCGGSVNEKCEVDADNPCIWIVIYQRLKGLGQLENLDKFYEPKNNKSRTNPSSVKVER